VDLASGAGVERALEGADAAVHCATDPLHPKAVDVGGARRVSELFARSRRRPHLVSVSIVGCDLVPYPYYRAKAAAEDVIAASGAGATVVRATQFHGLAASISRALTLGRVALTLGDLALQPVDITFVASRLADHAEQPAPPEPTRTTDLAGPDVLTGAELAARLRAHDGRTPPRVVRLPPVGAVLRALSAGTNLPQGDYESGGIPFDAWLASQPRH
jgi:uncharacterized protein YbjT (DUF2867 family)